MSVSFIYQNLQFYYRIDHLTRALPVIAWGCRDLPVRGESLSKESMHEDIKVQLKEYYRNRPSPTTCTDCGLTMHGKDFESQLTCPQCLLNQ
jgi:hypothetical protein